MELHENSDYLYTDECQCEQCRTIRGEPEQPKPPLGEIPADLVAQPFAEQYSLRAEKALETELDKNIFEQDAREVRILEGSDLSALPVNSRGEIDEHDVALFVTDELINPYHYARWKEEPVQFIAVNDLPWWLANVIKYTMRYDAKDGLKDLYKARTYLEMKIRQLEGVERFWVKPVAEERKLNDASAQIARKG